jgi:hypothetical protein
MHILSYDVASKSLGVSITYFNDNWLHDLNNIYNSYKLMKNKEYTILEKLQLILELINKIYNLVDTLYKPIFLDVVDLIPGLKVLTTNKLLISNRLRSYLYSLDTLLNHEEYYVLIENQMGPNHKSNNIQSQLIYHYATNDNTFTNAFNFKIDKNNIYKNNIDKNNIHPKYNIIIVDAKYKNLLNLDPNNTRQYFIEKYAKTYDANKKHSIANMLVYLKQKKSEHLLDNIKKNNLDDAADSIMQALSWLILKSGIINPN